MKEEFICPKCKNVLLFANDKYTCRRCGIDYPVRNGIICFYKTSEGTNYFSAEMAEFLSEKEKKHFWHQGRKEIIFEMIKKYTNNQFKNLKMIEIGCGTGNILKYLLDKGVNIEGGDASFESLEFAKNAKTVLYQIDAEKTPFQQESYDIVGLFDVLEHIDDDISQLKEMYRVCKNNGLVIITVPAWRFLWSYFDALSGHKRRYGKKELISKLKTAGFKIKKISFFVFLLFPLFVISRKLNLLRGEISASQVKNSSGFKINPFLNGVFLFILRLEKILIKKVDLPIGSSLICIVQKT